MELWCTDLLCDITASERESRREGGVFSRRSGGLGEGGRDGSESRRAIIRGDDACQEEYKVYPSIGH